jgi:hypothetical protein
VSHPDPFATDPNRLECHPSKVKMIGLLVLAFALLFVCYSCTRLPGLKAMVAGWVGIVFFGAALVIIPFRFFAEGPQIVIDTQGIDDHRLGVGMIPWADIRELRFLSVQGSEFLAIDVIDPPAYISRMSRMRRLQAKSNEARGFPAVCIGFAGLDPGVGGVKAFLRDRGRV